MIYAHLISEAFGISGKPSASAHYKDRGNRFTAVQLLYLVGCLAGYDLYRIL